MVTPQEDVFDGPRVLRTDHQILQDIAQLLTESLAVQRHILSALDAMHDMAGERVAAMPRETSISSVEVKFLAPTKDNPQGKPQPIVKVYADSPAPVEEAIEAYGRTVLLAQQANLKGWKQTVAAIADRNGGTA